jgi:glycosyltransferase involved in cell wall biosynthesis
MLEKLREMYGHRISMFDLRHVWDPRVYVNQDVFMTREIQEHAEQLIVHSQHQRDIMRLECPGAAPRTHLAPLGVPEPPSIEPEPRQGEGPLVVTLGLVSSAAKRMPLLLAGFADLLAAIPDARLHVVGELGEGEEEGLSSLIAKLGVAGSVELRGRVDRDEYWRTLMSADLAVQLRASLNAGPSAAVSDCVAARVPVIATGIGSLRELPEHVVLSVPEECSAERLAERMSVALRDRGLREKIRAAQDRYADECSFARVAERYADVLAL